MKHGFIKTAAITPDILVGDTEFNTDQIIKNMEAANNTEVKLAVFPELCLTGYTCNDLFLQDILLKNTLIGLKRILKESAKMDMVTLVGFPFFKQNSLYNTAAVIYGGKILGIVPKQNIPNYSEFYEARHFARPAAHNLRQTISQNLFLLSISAKTSGCRYLHPAAMHWQAPP